MTTAQDSGSGSGGRGPHETVPPAVHHHLRAAPAPAPSSENAEASGSISIKIPRNWKKMLQDNIVATVLVGSLGGNAGLNLVQSYLSAPADIVGIKVELIQMHKSIDDLTRALREAGFSLHRPAPSSAPIKDE